VHATLDLPRASILPPFWKTKGCSAQLKLTHDVALGTIRGSQRVSQQPDLTLLRIANNTSHRAGTARDTANDTNRAKTGCECCECERGMHKGYAPRRTDSGAIQFTFHFRWLKQCPEQRHPQSKVRVRRDFTGCPTTSCSDE